LCDGEFGREAVNEIVDSLTKPQFMRKVIVILAGYSEEINHLLRINPGLSSRFPEEVIFENINPQQGLALLVRELENDGIEVSKDFHETTSEQYLKAIGTLKQLSRLPSWGNGRDIKTLSKSLAAAALERTEDLSSPLIVNIADVARALNEMLHSQKARSGDESIIEATRDATDSTNSGDAMTSPSAPFITTLPALAEEIDKQEQPAEIPPQDVGVSDENQDQPQAEIASNEAVFRSNSETIAAQEQNSQKMIDSATLLSDE